MSVGNFSAIVIDVVRGHESTPRLSLPRKARQKILSHQGGPEANSKQRLPQLIGEIRPAWKGRRGCWAFPAGKRRHKMTNPVFGSYCAAKLYNATLSGGRGKLESQRLPQLIDEIRPAWKGRRRCWAFPAGKLRHKMTKA
jgi:hypothetical protein